MKTKSTRLAIFIAFLFLAPVQADYALTITNQGVSSFNGNWTLGYSFTANTDMEVAALGFMDWDLDGLTNSHEVGIWDASGTSLASTTVSPSDALDGNYRYSSISSLDLSSGQTYYIGGFGYANDGAIFNFGSGVSVAPSSDISIVAGQWVSGSGLSFPANTTTAYYPTVDFQTVPEPGVLSLLVVLSGMALSAWRRR